MECGVSGEEFASAWVVFHGRADLPWLRILKPGFRHCYALIKSGGQWISIDPMLSRMEVRAHTHLPAEFDLPGWLAVRGNTIVRAVIDGAQAKAAPWRPFTCVEAVKRVLGLHARGVLTPWQLYKFLIQPDEAKEIYHGKPDLITETLPVVQPQVITVESAPVTADESAAATSSTSTSAASLTPTDAQVEAGVRASQLQEQSRGLLSTVNTSYEGVLNDAPMAQGKSLLGE